jgi:hypothetical protein
VADAGGTLKLLSLTQRVKDSVRMTKVHAVFDVCDEAYAVLSFANTVVSARRHQMRGLDVGR